MLDLMEAVPKLASLASAQADEFEAPRWLCSRRTDRANSTVRLSEQQLKRVARLLVDLAGDHQRIEVLEERVEKPERKAG